MRKFLKLGMIGLLFLLLGFGSAKEEAYAKSATAYFGTEEGYKWNVGEKSPMGFYLASDEGNLTEVELIITYDPEVLEFKSQNENGVTVLSEGKISLKQEGDIGTEYKKILQFVPLVSCETKVEISEARGKVGENDISSDMVVSARVLIPMEEGCELRSIEIDGERLEGFESEIQTYELEVEYEIEQLPITATVYDGTEVEISDTGLEVGENQVYITTTNEKKQKARYTLNVVRREAVAEPEDVVQDSLDAMTAEGIADSNGEITEGNVSETSVLNETNSENKSGTEEQNANKENNKSNWKQNLLKLAVVLVGILLVFEIVLLVMRIRKQQRRRFKKQEELKTRGKITEFEIDEFETEEVSNTEEVEEEPVVIRGNKICMDFDRAVNEYTSIKELAIQTVKGKRVKEKYRALNEVSFEIRKGEVIGVIGTNGAGKSTLLKIIAGAMYPTSGSIKVNQGKIQILTLGTGFDMELTGKENVYLNGAIIGYEKEFIDEHYEEIVEFAELQDFMDEKVKNYSSGMVSRLGFAIATVGEAAEILILDEVLSVGDRIFQQKSMKRIKEMIHGGSTVIMVSHSTKTISENCDRAMWLEKGHLIAMGSAKKLCAAYEKYDGNFERVLRLKERLKRE